MRTTSILAAILLVTFSGLQLAAQVGNIPAGKYLNPVHKLLMYNLSESSTEGADYDANRANQVFDLLSELNTDGVVVKAWNKSSSATSPASFVKVTSPVYPGVEVYMDTRWLVPGGVPATVISESPIFSIPLIQAPTRTLVSRGTVVVVDPAFNDPTFARVVGWDDVRNVPVQGVLVLRATLSTKQVDVEAATRLGVVKQMTTNTNEQRLLVLETPLAGAGNTFSGSVFYEEYLALNTQLGGNAASDRSGDGAADGSSIRFADSVPYTVNTAAFAPRATVDTDRLNVRSVPSITGTAVHQLQAGDVVTLAGKTLLSYEVTAVEPGPWYLISEPVSGWVFGSFLDFGN